MDAGASANDSPATAAAAAGASIPKAAPASCSPPNAVLQPKGAVGASQPVRSHQPVSGLQRPPPLPAHPRPVSTPTAHKPAGSAEAAGAKTATVGNLAPVSAAESPTAREAAESPPAPALASRTFSGSDLRASMRSAGLLKKRMADVVVEATTVALREYEARHRQDEARLLHEDHVGYVATASMLPGQAREAVLAGEASAAASARAQPAQTRTAATPQSRYEPPARCGAASRVQPAVFVWSGKAALPATVYADARICIGWTAPGRVLASSTAGSAAVWCTHAAHSEVQWPLGQCVPLQASACAVACGSGAWQLTASIVGVDSSIPAYNVSIVKPSALGTDHVTMIITVLDRSQSDPDAYSILSFC